MTLVKNMGKWIEKLKIKVEVNRKRNIANLSDIKCNFNKYMKQQQG